MFAVKAKFMECCIINPALRLLLKHLVIGQRQKALYFSALHWSPHGSLVSIDEDLLLLHGPSMFAVYAKIYGVVYNQYSSIAFAETSSYRSAPKGPLFLGFSLVTKR